MVIISSSYHHIYHINYHHIVIISYLY